MATRGFGVAVGIKITDGRQLRRALKEAGEGLDDLRDLNKEAGSIVARALPDNTPVGPDEGGHLFNTIRLSATPVRARISAGDKSKPYAGVLHWGSPHTSQRSQPWMHTTAKVLEPKWTAVYWDRLEQIIAKAARAAD
ncbi:hypothetical protein [Zhihengliuella halotolerans]|uniref:HK97 gp10 family phage protein n=1 Tax=Zhihengliuella halotolerans TaxID=370736 RepID=A0A4Q8ABG7_9MICC|nr:hypothetical protein [Zhihengliuella halotolerans]RZU61448.1 hypothetical protein EV380_1018 [Zhihengliuella halotolerans]